MIALTVQCQETLLDSASSEAEARIGAAYDPCNYSGGRLMSAYLHVGGLTHGG